jgi:hypothetical protein
MAANQFAPVRRISAINSSNASRLKRSDDRIGRIEIATRDIVDENEGRGSDAEPRRRPRRYDTGDVYDPRLRLASEPSVDVVEQLLSIGGFDGLWVAARVELQLTEHFGLHVLKHGASVHPGDATMHSASLNSASRCAFTQLDSEFPPHL